MEPAGAWRCGVARGPGKGGGPTGNEPGKADTVLEAFLGTSPHGRSI